MAMAERIRKARRIAGLSQQALAETLGVTRSAVSNWESVGGALPTTDKLATLAKALHVGFEWIATGRGEMRLATGVGHMPEPECGSVVDCPHELQLLHAYRRAPARVKALLQEMAILHAPSQSRARMLKAGAERSRAA